MGLFKVVLVKIIRCECLVENFVEKWEKNV